MKKFLIVLFLVGFYSTSVMSGEDGKVFVFKFNRKEITEEFEPAQTKDRGKLSEWKIVDDTTSPSDGKALRVFPDPKTNYGSCFNLLIHKNIKAKDLEISVKLKAVKGKEDQGGGIIWRAKDKDNYYIVRWNPLEDNFRLYIVKKGRRRMIATTRLKTDPHKWHTIKVVHRGNKIQCYFDDKLQLEKKDTTFKEEGKIGLWTKADASTEFAELKVKVME